jgi:hypothetical protein
MNVRYLSNTVIIILTTYLLIIDNLESEEIFSLDVFTTNGVTQVYVLFRDTTSSSQLLLIQTISDFVTHTVTDPYLLWSIQSSDQISIQLVSHYTDFSETAAFRKNEQNRRTLVVLYNKHHVHIVENMQKNVTLDMSSNTKSSFYSTTDSIFSIDAASVFSEPVRRVTSGSQCGDIVAEPSESLNLVLVLSETDTVKKKLMIRNLREFSAYKSSETTGDPVNPVGRADNWNCVNGFYDSNINQCTESYSTTVDINHSVTKIHSAFAGKLDITDESIISSYCSQNSNDPNECLNGITINCETEMVPYFLRSGQPTGLIALVGADRVSLFSIRPGLLSPVTLNMEAITQMQSIGRVVSSSLSSNGQHMSLSISRKKWEIDSLERMIEICKKVLNNADDQFLEQYREVCHIYRKEITDVNLNMFGQYTSMCPAGMTCLSLNEFSYSTNVEDGYYIPRSSILTECTEGNFCRAGIQIVCPIGFMCPERKLSLPVPCSVSDNFQQTCSK